MVHWRAWLEVVSRPPLPPSVTKITPPWKLNFNSGTPGAVPRPALQLPSRHFSSSFPHHQPLYGPGNIPENASPISLTCPAATPQNPRLGLAHAANLALQRAVRFCAPEVQQRSDTSSSKQQQQQRQHEQRTSWQAPASPAPLLRLVLQLPPRQIRRSVSLLACATP